MPKRIFITLTTLIIVISLGYSSFLAYGMYERYEETIRWENSSMLSEIHQVPPSLARNYISPEEKRFFKVLTDVNIALNEIIKEGEVDDKKQEEYWNVHDEAITEIENNVEVYEAFPDKEIFDNFSLYLNADLTIRKAYDELNVEGLKEYSETLSKRLSNKKSKIESNLFNELKEISNDYLTLNEFSRNAIARLGVVEKDILKVGIQVDKSLTDDMLHEIKSKGLTKFAHIDNLAKTLGSNSWSSMLTHNITTKEYYSWKESQAILDSLLQANYVAIDSFKTVKDILDYDSSTTLAYKSGYSIDDDSKVSGVYHNGSKLERGLYIVRGANLRFDIEYKYTKTPEQYALEEVNKALISRDEDDIAAARDMVDNLKSSGEKEKLSRELDDLEADIQREIDEEKERIEEEKRIEEELELELEKEEQEAEQEQETDDDNDSEDDEEDGEDEVGNYQDDDSEDGSPEEDEKQKQD